MRSAGINVCIFLKHESVGGYDGNCRKHVGYHFKAFSYFCTSLCNLRCFVEIDNDVSTIIAFQACVGHIYTANNKNNNYIDIFIILHVHDYILCL